jgi:hypothetical protein
MLYHSIHLQYPQRGKQRLPDWYTEYTRGGGVDAGGVVAAVEATRSKGVAVAVADAAPVSSMSSIDTSTAAAEVILADAVPVSSIEAARAKGVAVAATAPVSSTDTSNASTEMKIILQRLQEAAAKAANDHGEYSR